MGEDLAVLQADFPAFRIWQEQLPGRVRYVARSRAEGINPHTVITADVDELREALQPTLAAGDLPAVPFSPDPNIARMYSYWLSQKDHHLADRAAANKVLDQFPEVAEIARANRASPNSSTSAPVSRSTRTSTRVPAK